MNLLFLPTRHRAILPPDVGKPSRRSTASRTYSGWLLALLLLLTTVGAQAQTTASKIYWVQSSATAADDRLSSANLDGTSQTTLASGASNFDNPNSLWVDAANGIIYVGDAANAATTGIRSFSLTGTLLNTIVPGTAGTAITGLQVAGNKLYWVQSSGTAANDQLVSANLDGTGVTILASGASNFDNPNSLWVDAANGIIYVGDAANAATTGIRSFSLTGTLLNTIVPGTAGTAITGLQVAGNKLYWVQSSGTAANDQLVSANLDGTGRTALASGNSATTFFNPQSLRVDIPNSVIYVGDGAITGSTGISRFSLTGTYINTVVAGGSLFSFNGLASNSVFAVAPTVTTAAAASITTTSAVLGGNVTADGGATVTERGVVYSTTNTTPTTSDTKDINGNSTGTFSETISGLTPGTVYYVRAYAINSVATSYGSVVSFTTPPNAPVVTAPANGALVNSTTPTYTGTAPANSTVQVYVDGAALASTTTANASGNWSITQPTALAQGSHTVRATASINGSSASASSNINTFTVDTLRPTVAISSTAGASGATTNTSPIPFTVTFSESVTGFVAGDLTVTNGSVSGFSGSGTTYTFNVTPTTAGTATTVNVPANVAQDGAGNGNTAAPSAYSLTYNIPTATVVSVTRLTPSPTATPQVRYQVVFSSSVTGVNLNNFTLSTSGLTGTGIASVSGSGTTYTVTANTGTGDGSLRLDVNNTSNNISPTLSNVPYTSGETYTITRSFAAAPTLRIQAAGSNSGNSDVTAFVDVVQVVQSGTSTVVANGVQNGSFETNNVAASNYLYQSQGVVAAPWSFGVQAGVSRNNSAFSSTAFDGDAVAILQSATGNNGSVSQNLAVPTGSYQVNFRTIQRNYTSLDQRLNVFVNDVFVGNIQPNNIPTYDLFTSASFSVTAPALTVAISSTASNPTSTSPIPVTVTFSASVTGFTASDVVVSNGALSGFSGTGTTYTFNVTPSASGTVTVNVPANVAVDANNTGNTAATQFSIQYNQAVTAAPVVTVPANGSQVATTTPTYTGTAVANSTVQVYVDGAALASTTTATASGNWSITQPSALAQGSHTVYATAQTNGAAVSANSNTNTFTVDSVRPTVAISSTASNPTSTSPIPVTVTFSEAVTGFVTGDITVTGGTISGFSGSGTTYSFSVTPSASGTVTVNVPANVAQDGAGNGNTAATQFSIQYNQPQTLAPIVFAPANGSLVSTTTPTYGGTAPISSTVTVYVDGSSIGTTTANGSGNWSLTQPSALAQGSHTVYATAQTNGSSISANSNTNTFTVDSVQPTVAFSSTATSPTSTSPIPVTVTFSESVTGFTASDVVVSNGTLTAFTGSGANYSFGIIPASNGAVTANIPANVAQDAAGNPNAAAQQFLIFYSQPVTAAPVVTVPANSSQVATTTPTYAGTAPANSTVQVYVDGAALASTTTATASGNWSITQPTALAQGSHTVYATAQTNGAAVSANSNTNTFTVDSVRPTVAISSAAGANGSTTGTAPIPFTVTFSETVTGFVQGDLTVTGGTLSGFSGSGATYSFSVTPTSNGTTVVVNVPANVAQDGAGNGNTAATQFSIIYSQAVTATPTVTVPANGSQVATTTPTYTGTAVANSTVQVYVDGAALPSTTANASGNWSITQPSALAQGSHTVYATAQSSGQAVSASSNTNTFIVDSVQPTVAISSTAGASGTTTSTSPLPFTVTFSETVTGFVQGDLTVTGGTISGFSGSGATYSFSVTPPASGTVTVNVPANVAQDGAGNGNTAATQFTFIYSQPVTPAPVVAEPANGSLVNNNRPIYGGTAAAGSTVTVYVDGSAVGTTTTNGSGIWGLIQPTALAQGSHTVRATAQLSGLAVSVDSNTNTFTVDTLPPTVLLNASGLSNGATTSTSPVLFSVSFSESVTGFTASDVVVSNGTISNFVGSGANYSFNVTPSANGTVTVNVPANVAVDAAGNGNTAASPFSFIYNQAVTAAPVVTVPANGSQVATTTPTYTGTAVANSTVQVYVDGAALASTTTATASGNWSITQPSALAQGSHTVYATAQTNGAAVSANSNTNTFTVDSVRPTVAISSTASNPTSTSPIPVTVTFSEAVTGFVTGDITVTGGTISGFSGSGTTYSFSVTPSASGTVTVNVPANVAQDGAGNGNTAATQFSIQYNAVVTATTWTGSVSTDWFANANWTAGVPTSTVDAIINSGAPRYPSVTTGNATVKNLILGTNAALSQSGGIIVVNGAGFAIDGTFTASGGLVSMAGSSEQRIGGTRTTFWDLTIGTAGARLDGPVDIQRTLTLDGNLSTINLGFTLLSNSTGTAMVINNNGATVIGQATMQRYIDPSRNTGLGYRHYSSPVQTTTVADLATSGFSPVVNPDYNTQGNTVTPFPTVYGYDQARIVGTNATTQNFDYGYFSPNSLGDNLVRGRGYTVNIAASEKVDLTGTLNSGTVAVGSLSFGTEANSGWHLLGNPYPAPLDWNKARTNLPAGVIDAIYVYKSSTQYGGIYQFYQNGFGTLPNGTVPAMAGFFLRVNQPVASFNFQNAWRSTSYDSPVFNRPAADSRPALQLDLVSAQGVHDPTYVYFEEGATAGLDDHYDAEKLPNTTGLNLASVAVGKGLAVNGLPLLTTSTLVPLTVGVPVTGTYTLQAASLANFGTTSIYLHDAVTGQQVDLQQQASYTFSASNAALITGRFSLSFGAVRPLGVGSSALAASVTLYPNPARKTAWIELPAALGRKPVTVSMLDAVGREVRKEVLPALGSTAHALSLQELPVGVYLLRLSTEAGTITKRLIIE